MNSLELAELFSNPDKTVYKVSESERLRHIHKTGSGFCDFEWMAPEVLPGDGGQSYHKQVCCLQWGHTGPHRAKINCVHGAVNDQP